MEKKDVPRDGGSEFGILLQSFYVLNENGDYECVKCDGWETLNIAYNTAKEFDNEDLAGVLERVKKGELSPLAYYMNRQMLDAKALAQYVGLPKWRVKQHLKPRSFKSLDDEALNRYALVLKITVEQLKEAP
jgi:hypothetical protein